MKPVHMYGLLTLFFGLILVSLVLFEFLGYIALFLAVCGMVALVIAIWRFWLPGHLALREQRHKEHMDSLDRGLIDRMQAIGERPGYSSKMQANAGNWTIEVIAPQFPRVQTNEVQQSPEQAQIEAPKVTQPSMEEMYNAIPYNSLQVAFGKTLEKGDTVIVPIIGGVHFKLVGGSGFGKSCLAAALLDIATKRNDPDHLRIALLDLEYKTSRLFENLPHVLEVGGQRRRRLVAKDADEVASQLGLLRKELDRRASNQIAAPLLLMYVEEMLSLQYEVDEKLKAQMLADLAILALRGRKYGMFLMACTQTDYSTKELKEAQKQFRTRSGFAIDPSAARAAGFVNTELVNYNYRNAKPGQFLLERPAFSELVLAPRYDVEEKLLSLSSTNRRYYPASNAASPVYYQDSLEVDDEADTEPLEVAGEVVTSQPSLTPQEWRIVQKWKNGDSVSKIIEEEFGVKGGAAFTQRAKQLQTLIARFLPDYAVESEA